MKRNTTSVIKFKKLCLALGLPSYAVVGILECLWHITAREAPRGDIGRLSNEEIALGMDWVEDPDRLIGALVACRWIDENAEHRLIVHDWPDHTEDATHTKLFRAIETFADGTVPKARSIGSEEKKRLDRLWASAQVQETTANHMPDDTRTSANHMPDVLPKPKPLPKPTTSPLPPSPASEPGGARTSGDDVDVGLTLQGTIDEIWEIYPAEAKHGNPTFEKSGIKAALLGCGLDPPQVHYAKVLAGVKRMVASFEQRTSEDRKTYIPGFKKFFGERKWEGEWEVRKPKEPDKPEESVSMFDPKGILFAVREDEVEELIAKGWTRELVKPVKVANW